MIDPIIPRNHFTTVNTGDPTKWSDGYITSLHLDTHGFGISRGLHLTALHASEDCRLSDMERNFRDTMDYAYNASGTSDAREAMMLAISHTMMDLVDLAAVFHINLHQAVDDALCSQRNHGGLPIPSRSPIDLRQ